MKEAHEFSKVRTRKEIENAKPYVPSMHCVVSVNFEKILSE